MKILCIGNSYSFYWTDELWGLLNAAGVKDLRVSNVYYSGCTFERHWNWYEEKFPGYNFYTVENGVRTVEKEVDLEYCLSAESEWDIISFQQSNRYGYKKDEGAAHRASIQAHLPQLYKLVHDRFPNAKYYWLQSWAHELRQSEDTLRGVGSIETQKSATAVFRNVGQEVCREYGFEGVPCGDAWELIRHEPMFYEKGEGPEPVRSLHTRVYKASMKNYDEIFNGDLSHDGDIGGGQYLNGCVWFEMIMKKSVVGNTFRPTYTHEPTGMIFQFTEEKIAALQNAAHTAVLNTYGEDFYK